MRHFFECSGCTQTGWLAYLEAYRRNCIHAILRKLQIDQIFGGYSTGLGEKCIFSVFCIRVLVISPSFMDADFDEKAAQAQRAAAFMSFIIEVRVLFL